VIASPFVAGLHLGLLQTGYLLVLARALSSAHTTYALVLVAWLIGATLGLWWRVSARTAVVIGLVAYLGVQLALGAVDFVALSPWWFAPAVAASGLWSGRFFAGAIAGAARPGRVFAGETDGFLVGALVAVVGYAFAGRHALWILPLVTGAALLGGKGAIAAMLLVVGCEDPQARLPAPDPRVFRDTVYPVLLRDCGFAGCHGDPRRPLFTPGPGRVRLDPASDLFDPPTAAEVARSYDRARALLLREGDEPPPLLHKPGPEAAHRGRDAAGRNIYEDTQAPGLLALTAWADGAGEGE
jgi:hypothetical protein